MTEEEFLKAQNIYCGMKVTRELIEKYDKILRKLEHDECWVKISWFDNHDPIDIGFIYDYRERGHKAIIDAVTVLKNDAEDYLLKMQKELEKI